MQVTFDEKLASVTRSDALAAGRPLSIVYSFDLICNGRNISQPGQAIVPWGLSSQWNIVSSGYSIGFDEIINASDNSLLKFELFEEEMAGGHGWLVRAGHIFRFANANDAIMDPSSVKVKCLLVAK
jgi:hypothetical protein